MSKAEAYVKIDKSIHRNRKLTVKQEELNKQNHTIEEWMTTFRCTKKYREHIISCTSKMNINSSLTCQDIYWREN